MKKCYICGAPVNDGCYSMEIINDDGSPIKNAPVLTMCDYCTLNSHTIDRTHLGTVLTKWFEEVKLAKLNNSNDLM